MASFERDLLALLPRLRRFARALSHDAADADDLCQAALEKALVGRERWPGTRLDSWMYRIMRNTWIDTARMRTRATETFVAEEAGAAVADRGDAAIETNVAISELMRAMAALPDEQREAVALVLVEGLAYKDAAAVLDVPIGTLTSRLVRGRQALAARLGRGMTFDDAMLMAYADGELDAVTARRIEQALADDAVLAGRLAAQRRLRERLATGFGEVLDEPVPDRLAAMLERRVVPLRPPARSGQPWLGAVAAAAAAALVIGVGLGRFSAPNAPIDVGGGGLVAAGALAATLDRAPSGSAGATRILASFRDEGGRYCRTFSGRPTDGIACRAGTDWALVMTRSSPPASSSAYRQAGSADAPLLAAAQAMMAGDPLTPAQERDAVAAGWR